ncbi:RNA polymerase sigma factor [Phytoactinopolyspora halophila]|uniref:RNA polymerase sigma factor n=1 Tax=Phytoactinopolyspora halophila TaxID=1981511 RepID=UPI0013147C1C|nr:sigma-70 family RNA polymerase sigma factor [Phytoactinopolyspora halophila]
MSVSGERRTAGSPSDKQLWSRARSGDPSAFGELFTRHSQTIYSFCFRLTASWKTAEDLTTIVFLEAWRRRDQTSVDSAMLVPWLLGIASQVAQNSARAVRRHRHLLSKLPPAVVNDDHDESASAARRDAERQMKEILRVFHRLPKREQEVLALCVWGERTPAEAAIALGITVGTARSRLARAHGHLSRLLAGTSPSITVRRDARLRSPTQEAS